MKYINTFKTLASYEEKLNVGVDISLPNVSYCEDVKDIHYNPYNTVEFYVGEITEPQTVNIYTDSSSASVDVTVSEGNKWYSYVLPKDKGLIRIIGNTVKKVNVKANLVGNNSIIPYSTIEASFKGSNTSNLNIMVYLFYGYSGLTSLDLSGWDTSNVTNMGGMFEKCSNLTSLDLSGFDTSKVTNMNGMFDGCTSLTTIKMKGCSEATIQKITDIKPSGATIVTE